jgi:hypothetical protein
MNQPQEGAESILDYAKPVHARTGASFWQMCKLKAWDAAVGLIASVPLVLVFLHTAKPVEVPTAPAVAAVAAVAAQTDETPQWPQTTPKKIARKAIKPPTVGANFPVSDDVLGEFIAELARKKANPLPKKPKNKEPAPSASNLEQDFESRLFNFERKIP